MDVLILKCEKFGHLQTWAAVLATFHCCDKNTLTKATNKRKCLIKLMVSEG